MTTVREVTAHFDAARQREFRRFLVASALLHLGAFALMSAVPTLPAARPSGAIAVNLVAAPRAARAVPAAPAPAAPKPRPPKPAPVVLPTEPTLPKPRPAPRVEEPPEPEPAPEQEYGDVMARLRQEMGEEALQEPAETAEPEVLGTGGPGPARPVSPELARWIRDARIHVRRNWTLPGSFRMQSLVAEVEVELDAAGHVQGTPRIARRSGNPWYDDGVVRSVQKASPLPAPPEAGSWTFVFASDEDL